MFIIHYFIAFNCISMALRINFKPLLYGKLGIHKIFSPFIYIIRYALICSGALIFHIPITKLILKQNFQFKT